MIEKVKTEEEYLVVRNAYYQYLGNRNILKQRNIDSLLLRALAIKKPHLAFELIENHAELLYHPSEAIIQ